MQDYRSLPKLRDSISHLYVEHAIVDREAQAIALHDKDGVTSVPASSLTLLLLGPGTSITHAAIKVLADSGCLTVWGGEGGIRYYAHGIGETRKAYKLERQARLWADELHHMEVVRAMYALRLRIRPDQTRTLEQLRGMEGARVKNTYAAMSQKTGVPWSGRSYDRNNWSHSDDINRALSTANACLYGICHAGIVSAGYSPGLGFIHSGKQLSFVYDIADLYKADMTIPLAFEIVGKGPKHLEREVRKACRDRFHESKLLDHILVDIEKLFQVAEKKDSFNFEEWEENMDPSRPLAWWDPESLKSPGDSALSDPIKPKSDNKDDSSRDSGPHGYSVNADDVPF